MTLREKIFKTFVVTIREINTHGGPEKFFEKYPVGGMYYGEAKRFLNDEGREVGTSTTFETLNLCKKYSKNKLWVCADGAAMRGQKIKMHPQTSLGASVNLEDAYNFGKITGMQMNDKGIDMVLGPSIDMCFDHLMYLTAISNDPETIVKVYTEFIKGVSDQGVCTTVKHFPGLGTYFMNMHMAPGSNTLPFDEWMKTYGYTYKELFKAGASSVMTTHTTLKSYDNETHNGFYPIATYSEKLTTDLLKGELGFEGAVITDALIMGGMATGDLVAETVQAFRAGADLLLWPPVEAADEIERLIESGDIPMSRLDDALARIGKMEKFRQDALDNNKFDTPDSEFIDENLLKITKNGICMLRNERNILPVSDKSAKILIVDMADEDKFSSNALKEELEAKGFSVDVKCEEIYDEPSRVCWQADIDRIQAEYDFCIFNVNTAFMNQWSMTHMLIWASHLFDKNKKIIVNYGSPYFAEDYFPEDPTIIEMNCSPSKETVRMLADVIDGEFVPTGKSLLKERR